MRTGILRKALVFSTLMVFSVGVGAQTKAIKKPAKPASPVPKSTTSPKPSPAPTASPSPSPLPSPTPLPGPSPLPSPAQAAPEKVKDEELKKFSEQLAFWGTFGLGVPGESFQKPSLAYGVGGNFYPKAGTAVGGTIRNVSAKAENAVNFPSTGYTETRVYKVGALMFLGQGLYELSSEIRAVGYFGISMTSSTLESVTTTAPLPSSLASGTKKDTLLDLAYGLGGQYEYRYGKWGLIGEGGYMVTALNPDSAIKEIYISFVAKFYPFRDSDN